MIVDEGPVIEPTESPAAPRARHIRVRRRRRPRSHERPRRSPTAAYAPSTTSTSRSRPVRSSASSGRTVPARRASSTPSPASRPRRGTIEFMGAALEDAHRHTSELAAAWPAPGRPATSSTICPFARTCASLPSEHRLARWSWTSSAASRPTDQANVNWALDLVGLSEHADDKPTSLSIGQQKLARRGPRPRRPPRASCCSTSPPPASTAPRAEASGSASTTSSTTASPSS